MFSLNDELRISFNAIENISDYFEFDDTSKKLTISNVKFDSFSYDTTTTHNHIITINSNQINLNELLSNTIDIINKIDFYNCSFKEISIKISLYNINFYDCKIDKLDAPKHLLYQDNSRPTKYVKFDKCKIEELRFGDIRDRYYNRDIK